MTEQRRYQLQHIDHVELNVPDRYAAAAWYERVFGLSIVPDFEVWAQNPQGPLMIDLGGTKLALFEGRSSDLNMPTNGFHLVAFRADARNFLAFVAALPDLALTNDRGQPVTAAAIVDHDRSWSFYFTDPWGHRFEITTYDYESVKQQLQR